MLLSWASEFFEFFSLSKIIDFKLRLFIDITCTLIATYSIFLNCKLFKKENTKFMDYIVASSPIAAIVINFYIYEYWISMIYPITK